MGLCKIHILQKMLILFKWSRWLLVTTCIQLFSCTFKDFPARSESARCNDNKFKVINFGFSVIHNKVCSINILTQCCTNFACISLFLGDGFFCLTLLVCFCKSLITFTSFTSQFHLLLLYLIFLIRLFYCFMKCTMFLIYKSNTI